MATDHYTRLEINREKFYKLDNEQQKRDMVDKSFVEKQPNLLFRLFFILFPSKNFKLLESARDILKNDETRGYYNFFLDTETTMLNVQHSKLQQMIGALKASDLSIASEKGVNTTTEIFSITKDITELAKQIENIDVGEERNNLLLNLFELNAKRDELFKKRDASNSQSKQPQKEVPVKPLRLDSLIKQTEQDLTIMNKSIKGENKPETLALKQKSIKKLEGQLQDLKNIKQATKAPTKSILKTPSNSPTKSIKKVSFYAPSKPPRASTDGTKTHNQAQKQTVHSLAPHKKTEVKPNLNTSNRTTESQHTRDPVITTISHTDPIVPNKEIEHTKEFIVTKLNELLQSIHSGDLKELQLDLVKKGINEFEEQLKRPENKTEIGNKQQNYSWRSKLEQPVNGQEKGRGQ